MKKRLKRLPAMMVMLALAIGLAACSSDGGNAQKSEGTTPASSAGGSASVKSVTLKMMIPATKPADFDKVMTEFESRSKDTLNTKLDINFSTDMKQQLGLKMAAGEELDLAFDAGWMSLNQNVSNGYYQELDKYFNNDEYPGLKKAFSSELIEANKINGKLYVIPLTQYYYDIEAVMIRKDLREKYGLAPIQSYEDFKVYLEKVQENDSSMTPLALRGDRGFYRLFENETKQTNYRTLLAAGFNVVLSDDGKKVLGAVTSGDDAALYKDFPAPLNEPFYFEKAYGKYAEFSKFLEKDVMVQKDAGSLFISGKAAASEGTISGFSGTEQKLKAAVPGAELEMFVYKTGSRNLEPGTIGVTYKANNSLVIPVTSKHADQTMKFLDWIYSSQDNHDLIELGIEGEHWTKDGDKGYKPTEKFGNYNFPSYLLTLNPIMSRVDTNNNEEVLKYFEFASKPDSYYKVPLAQFTFNSEPVKTELAKVNTKGGEYYPLLKNGLDPNWQETMIKMNKELSALGLEKIRAELIKQVQAYLDNGGV